MAPIVFAAVRLAATNDDLVSGAASILGFVMSGACAYGCWYFARHSGRNEAAAIVWGILCGLLALVVYLVIYAQDNKRLRVGQAPFYPPGYVLYPPQQYPPAPVATGATGGQWQAAGRYCPRCGAFQKAGSVFCAHCGEKVPVMEQQPWADRIAGQPLQPGPPVANVDVVTPPAAPRLEPGAPPQAPGTWTNTPPPPPPPEDRPRPSQWK